MLANISLGRYIIVNRGGTMEKFIKTLTFLLIFIFITGSLSYSKIIDMPGMVDDFEKSTDLQRNQMLSDNLGKEISAGGVVNNVGEYDFFDITNDFKGTYYQVSTEQQKTKNNIPYQVIFLFKDRDKVKDLNKGQTVQNQGKIIRILDERLQISVWILCDELTEKDRLLFNQN